MVLLSTALRWDRSERIRARSAVDRGVAQLALGHPVVLTRQERGSARAALVLAAGIADADAVSFMVLHTTGFLSVALGPADAVRLGLPPMVSINQRSDGVCYAVSADAREGISTGISAADRSHTVRLMGDPATRSDQLSRPGHVVPVITVVGGVSARPGLAEAARDLTRLAGLHPAAVLADIVGDDGNVADLEGGRAFALQHGLAQVDVADLIACRAETCRPSVRRVSARQLPAPHQGVRVTEYQKVGGHGFYTAFCYGKVRGRHDVALHVMAACPDGDLFPASGCDCRQQLDAALRDITARRCGVLLYVRSSGIQPVDLPVPPERRHAAVDATDLAAAAQALLDLGGASFLLPAPQRHHLPALRSQGLALR